MIPSFTTKKDRDRKNLKSGDRVPLIPTYNKKISSFNTKKDEGGGGGGWGGDGNSCDRGPLTPTYDDVSSFTTKKEGKGKKLKVG